jgi:hypothetical protein
MAVPKPSPCRPNHYHMYLPQLSRSKTILQLLSLRYITTTTATTTTTTTTIAHMFNMHISHKLLLVVKTKPLPATSSEIQTMVKYKMHIHTPIAMDTMHPIIFLY